MNNNQEITYTRKVMCRSTSGVNVWGFIEAPEGSILAGQTVPCLIDKYASEGLAYLSITQISRDSLMIFQMPAPTSSQPPDRSNMITPRYSSWVLPGC